MASGWQRESPTRFSDVLGVVSKPSSRPAPSVLLVSNTLRQPSSRFETLVDSLLTFEIQTLCGLEWQRELTTTSSKLLEWRRSLSKHSLMFTFMGFKQSPITPGTSENLVDILPLIPERFTTDHTPSTPTKLFSQTKGMEKKFFHIV